MHARDSSEKELGCRMERVGGLGPEHEKAIARAAKTTRRQPKCVFFDVGGVLASDGLPSQGSCFWHSSQQECLKYSDSE